PHVCPTTPGSDTGLGSDTGNVTPDTGTENDSGVTPDAVNNDVIIPQKAEQPKEGCTIAAVPHHQTPEDISKMIWALLIANMVTGAAGFRKRR
ncbi:hypothetical protein COY06_01905, partial [Candidatus Peregrinibacteria bacterium CG_4_10_14_0_2_um_filter_41_8]